MTQPDSANAGSNTMFDKLAGKAKEVVGNALGDETLAEEGELQQRKGETAKRAVDLTAEAQQREAEAELKAEQAANRVEQQRVAAELAERQREQQLEQEKATAEAAVESEAARRETALDRQAVVEEKILDMKEENVVVDLVDGVTEASEIEREAARAAASADALEAAQRRLKQS